jgi:hypothetical protein
VKFLLPLGAVLLVGLALGLHRSPSPKPAGERPAPPRPSPVVQESLPVPASPSDREIREVPVPKAVLRGPVPKSAAPEPAAWRKMAAALEKDILLTAIQRASLERILREREEEIQACHQEMRNSGVIDIRRYEWQTGQMKDVWFLRLDALLDRSQHELFVALVQKGYLNEGLAFTVEPGMTVLD